MSYDRDPSSHTELPSVEEVLEFRDVINRGRVAMGLEPLEQFNYDACRPGSTTDCLSAAHLFQPAGYVVGSTTIYPEYSGKPDNAHAEIIDAIGAEAFTDKSNQYVIPEAIRRVTDPFDASDEEDTELWVALRRRMVEAGVVES